MRALLTIILLGILGTAGYYYWDTTEKHQNQLRKEQSQSQTKLSELKISKNALSEQIEQATQDFAQQEASKTLDDFGDLEDKNTLDEGTDSFNLLIAEILVKDVKSKTDLEKRRDLLHERLLKEENNLVEQEKKVNAQIESNTRKMEAKRTKVYQDFEQKYASSGKKLSQLGAIYAKEKRKLDEQSEAFRQRVIKHNETLKNKFIARRDKFNQQEPKIKQHIESLERLIDSTKEDDLANMDILGEFVAEGDVQSLFSKEIDNETAGTDSERHLLALKNKLADVDLKLTIEPLELEKKISGIEKEYNQNIKKIYMAAGISSAIILLLLFSSALFSRIS